MGRECQTMVTYGAERGEAKVLLESRELVLRGAIKARLSRELLTQVAATPDGLGLVADGVPMTIAMTAIEAERWVAAISKPLPTLAAKLGIGPTRPALILGDVSDLQLAAALADATTGDAATAVVVLAMVGSLADLDRAAAAAAGLPLWCVYAKGRDAMPGDAAIRTRLRDAGWIDSKTCAVSDKLTATRYARRPDQGA